MTAPRCDCTVSKTFAGEPPRNERIRKQKRGSSSPVIGGIFSAYREMGTHVVLAILVAHLAIAISHRSSRTDSCSAGRCKYGGRLRDL